MNRSTAFVAIVVVLLAARHVEAQSPPNGSFESGFDSWSISAGKTGGTVSHETVASWSGLLPTQGARLAKLQATYPGGGSGHASASISQQLTANASDWLLFDYVGQSYGRQAGAWGVVASESGPATWLDLETSRPGWSLGRAPFAVGGLTTIMFGATVMNYLGESVLLLDNVRIVPAGSEQAAPFLPPPSPTATWVFNGNTWGWYDPPFVSSYRYETDGATAFTRVKLPVGLGDADGQYTITDTTNGSVTLGEGAEYTFLSPVTTFTISGIGPVVDAADSNAFPVYLEFNQTTANVTITPLPEPSTFVLLGVGAIGLLGYARRCRKSGLCQQSLE